MVDEVDGAVRCGGCIVRGIGFFAAEVVTQNGLGAVIVATTHAACVVFYGDQAALDVTAVSIGVA